VTPRPWTCCGWRPAPLASAARRTWPRPTYGGRWQSHRTQTLTPELTLELGSSALAAGDIETAVEHLSGAGRMPVSVTVRAAAAAELGTALTLTDRPAEAVRALTEAIQALPESERELGLFLQGTRCFTAASSLEAWRSLPTLPTPFDAVSDWRSDAVPLLLAAGRQDEARTLIDEQLRRCRAFGAPRPLGAALRAASLLHDRDESIPLLEEAVAVLETSPGRLERGGT